MISSRVTFTEIFLSIGQYPYRPVQIVLRLYHSPAEILAGFDIDVPCCAYDGNYSFFLPIDAELSILP